MPHGFGPQESARRLLRQSAGLMPPSDVQPVSGRSPAVEAALNLQLAQGLITKEQFEGAFVRRAFPTRGAPLTTSAQAARRPPRKPAARPVGVRPAAARQTQRAPGVNPFQEALRRRRFAFAPDNPLQLRQQAQALRAGVNF
jgi:hypothetical protein